MNSKLEHRLRVSVREVVKSIIQESDTNSVEFEGVLSFVDNNDITDRYLEQNYWGDIGGDIGDISDFKIYDDGTFSGYLVTSTSSINTDDDFSNLIYDILLNHDSNTYKFIDYIKDIKIIKTSSKDYTPKMERKLQEKFKTNLRKLVKDILKEESPMSPSADGFNPVVQKPQKPVRIGSLTVNMSNNTHLTITSGNKAILVKVEDAIKLAEYLYRVLGKV